MLFNSIEFAIFFPIVCALYFLLPFRMRTPMLLVASCVFYMALIPAYILILFTTILIDYCAAFYIERSRGRTRKILLVLSITSTCAVLFVFKYLDFFTGNLVGFAHLLGWKLSDLSLNIILPVGLSFHTFQSLSYVVEVYRGRQPTERNFVTYATYVMFFPQLVAGPIERPQNLLHQFGERHRFDYDRVTSGLKRMVWGFFKKLVIADRLALYVNDVYAKPAECNGLQLTLATGFFAYQIYCDFSGYSDIAIGSARVLGFRLIENFDRPYYALSTAEFWRRWHISLSTWFRDYVYMPLGGSRVAKLRWCGNILATFGISGLWHGANWTYVLWGLLNGLYPIYGRWTQNFRNRVFARIGLPGASSLRIAIRLVTTFLLTCAAWVLFRARNLEDAAYILTHWFRNWDFQQIATTHFFLRQFPVALGGLVALELVQLVHGRVSLVTLLQRLPQIPRWAVWVVLILAVVMFGVYRNTQFIYFQF